MNYVTSKDVAQQFAIAIEFLLDWLEQKRRVQNETQKIKLTKPATGTIPLDIASERSNQGGGCEGRLIQAGVQSAVYHASFDLV